MELIGARFCDQVHVRSRIPSVAGVVGGSLDLEFLNRVRIRYPEPCVNAEIRRGTGAGHDVHNGDAIHLIVVLLGPRSIDTHILRASSECRPVVQICGHSGGEAQNLCVIPAG